MFNFADLENVTNKVLDNSHVRVFSNNKVRIGFEGREVLGLSGTRKVLILKNTSTKDLYIASVDSESTEGRKVNSSGEFASQLISSLLGNKGAEWKIVGEGEEHPLTKDKYFKLEEVIKEIEVEDEVEDEVEAITQDSIELQEVIIEAEPENIYQTVHNEISLED